MTPRRPPTITPDTWTLALQVCTPNELLAIELDERGLAERTIALHLGISRRSVRDRIDNGWRKIHLALDHTAA